jgi:histidinol-phosphate aminotransferase
MSITHGDEYARGARLDFAVNVTDGPWPEWLQEAIERGTSRLTSYPDERAAISAVAERHGRAPEEVVLLNGGAQAFTLLATAFKPRAAVVVHPSFSEPERALRQSGHPPAHAILPEPYALRAALIPEDCDLVVIGNPTNPTGVLHPAQALAGLCREDRTTVVDEAFIDYVPGQAQTLAAARELPGLVVVRSLTKVLGVPGARAGYLLAPAPLAERLRAQRSHWSLNALAVEIIAAAARHRDHVEMVARITEERRRELSAALNALPEVTAHPAAANFLLLELPDAREVHERLLGGYGISTRPAWNFPGLDHRHLRVAVRQAQQNREFTEALAAVLAG